MAEAGRSTRRAAANAAVPKGQFVVDRAYIREQAREAVLTFVAPFTGVYRAVTGQPAPSRRTTVPIHAPGNALKPYSKARDKRKKAKPVSINHFW